MFVPKRNKEKGIAWDSLGLGTEEHSPSDWSWILELEVRMLFGILECFSPLFFQWC